MSRDVICKMSPGKWHAMKCGLFKAREKKSICFNQGLENVGLRAAASSVVRAAQHEFPRPTLQQEYNSK